MDEPVLYRPWGVVSPDFWAGAETQRSPETSVAPDVPKGLAAVQEAVTAGQHDQAQMLAEELDIAVTAAHGEVNLDTIQIREVRGYLAGLTGDLAAGLDWYLHTLRLRSRLHGPDSPDTDAAARRAYSLWRTLPSHEAQNAAGSLLAAINQAQGPDAVAAKWTRRRSAELAALLRSPAV
ncbi:hypothetical protein ABZW02_29615 [Streptomyces sp. NPDC005180]|uniref:hypothetical protein n=1 Tax=Streptomyces sp. NPDC005180 TaxID=3156868 RepID=UPI0033B90CB1